jgi:hypothetical protein
VRLLPQQFVAFALKDALLGDIFNSQQSRVGIFLVQNHAGNQQHGASSDVGKLMLDLVILDLAMLRNDFFQEQSKPRNVPLTIAQSVKQPALGAGLRDLECQIERATRREHPQVLVEHEKRLADGVDDRLGEDAGIFVFDERPIVLHDAPRCDPQNFFAAIRAGDSFASAIVEHGRFELRDGHSVATFSSDARN